MKFKPVNPNSEHDAAHQFLVAATGGGKSQLLKSGLVVPLKRETRVVGYDDVGSLPGLYFHDWLKFLRALRAAVSRGGGFRVFYAGDQSTDDYLRWCEVVWGILDGDHVTYAVSEEMAGPLRPGEAPKPVGMLLTQGRKFGLRHVGTTQRPALVPTTLYTQSRIKWVGQQDLYDQRNMARVAGVTEQQIRDLVSGKDRCEFYRTEGRSSGGELVAITPGPKVGVKWVD